MPGVLISRRRVLTGFGAAALALGLASCGGASATTAPTSSSAQAATSATAPSSAAATTAASTTSSAAAAAPAPAAPAGGSAQLVFFTWGSAERFKIWGDQVVGGFNKGHPGIVATLLEGPSDYEPKLLTMAAGGTAPDVFRLSEYWAVDIFAKNFCLQLDPYLARDKFKIEDHTSPPYTQCQYQGKWYAVPHGAAGNFVVWYNRDLFTKAQVAFPTDDWTWNDFLTTAKALTKSDAGKPVQWGTSMEMVNYGVPYSYIWSNGGDELTPDGKSYLLDQQPAMQALQLLADLTTKEHVAPTAAEIPQGLGDIFLSGKVAMHYSGAWYEATAHQAKFDFGLVLNPKMNASSERVAFAEQNATAAYRQGKHLDAAWQLLQYLISPENQKVESSTGLNGPSDPAILNSPDFLNVNGAPYSRKAIVPGLLAKTRGATLIPGYAQIQTAYSQKLATVWTGATTLQNAVPQVVAVAKQVIAQDQQSG